MIDEKDRKILRLLQKNSKQSLKKLSKKTGIRPTTIHERIKKMEKEKIIRGYTIDIDEKKIGYNVTAYILVRLKAGMLSLENEPIIANNPNIIDMAATSGRFDNIIKVLFKDVNELGKFTIKLRETPKNKIIFTETVLCFKNIRGVAEKPI